VADQPKVLENNADPAPEAGEALARHGDDIFAEQPDEAPARPLRQIKEPQQRGLAGPRRPGKEVEASLAKRKAEVRKRFRAGAVSQADVFELDDVAARDQSRLPLVRRDDALARRSRKA
jgi:hypothetical protein